MDSGTEVADTTAEPSELAVEISGLHKWFGDFHVLADINLKDNEIELMRAFIHYLPPSTPAGP